MIGRDRSDFTSQPARADLFQFIGVQLGFQPILSGAVEHAAGLLDVECATIAENIAKDREFLFLDLTQDFV